MNFCGHIPPLRWLLQFTYTSNADCRTISVDSTTRIDKILTFVAPKKCSSISSERAQIYESINQRWGCDNQPPTIVNIPLPRVLRGAPAILCQL